MVVHDISKDDDVDETFLFYLIYLCLLFPSASGSVSSFLQLPSASLGLNVHGDSLIQDLLSSKFM